MASIEERLRRQAHELGFELVGITTAQDAPGYRAFRTWLERGFAGSMSYMERHAEARRHPKSVLEDVRSIILVGRSYRPASGQMRSTDRSSTGRVSCYAWGDDYHAVMRRSLQQLLAWLRQQVPGCRGRAVVDTAPLLERDFARLAGLGWFGKNTMLIHPRQGSYFFIGALLVDVVLTADQPFATQHCGTCTACLDACPTGALVAPYQLDSRRGISYLTIEHRGVIDTELRPAMGDWVFGCDVCQEVCPWNRKAAYGTGTGTTGAETCQEVCPWNRKAAAGGEPAFHPVADQHQPDLVSLVQMTEAEFRQRYRGTALMRPGRSGMVRNAAIVLGNQGDPETVAALVRVLDDDDAVVRDAVAWALGRIGTPAARHALAERLRVETDPGVRTAIETALTGDDPVADQQAVPVESSDECATSS